VELLDHLYSGFKTCARCCRTKKLEQFYRRGDTGRQPYCKDCDRQNTAEWKESNRSQLSESIRKRRAKNPEKYRSSWKDWAKNNPEYIKQRARQYNLKKYGLTETDYILMLHEQDGGCAICGATEGDSSKKNLCVDHDHNTGKVRGLLCTACNHVIGRFEDDVNRLRRAADYIERHNDGSQG
jgi:hypothetical protein